jgi:hypothetical protein
MRAADNGTANAARRGIPARWLNEKITVRAVGLFALAI